MTRTKKGLLVAGGIIVAFLVGFCWQFVRAHSLSNRLDQAEHDLGVQRNEATLGAATIAAQRGQFEPARRLASDFFTSLQTTVEKTPDAAPALQPILVQRDPIITGLSRGDPQMVTTLGALFAQYRTAVGEATPSGASGTEPATTPASTTGG